MAVGGLSAVTEASTKNWRELQTRVAKLYSALGCRTWVDYYTVSKHLDSADPAVNPIGHIQDILFSPEHTKKRVRRTDLPQ